MLTGRDGNDGALGAGAGAAGGGARGVHGPDARLDDLGALHLRDRLHPLPVRPPLPPLSPTYPSVQRGESTEDVRVGRETCISERLIKTMADAMHEEGFVDAGYTYIRAPTEPRLP